jgi:hypothetical protein
MAMSRTSSMMLDPIDPTMRTSELSTMTMWDHQREDRSNVVDVIEKPKLGAHEEEELCSVEVVGMSKLQDNRFLGLDVDKACPAIGGCLYTIAI